MAITFAEPAFLAFILALYFPFFFTLTSFFFLLFQLTLYPLPFFTLIVFDLPKEMLIFFLLNLGFFFFASKILPSGTNKLIINAVTHPHAAIVCCCLFIYISPFLSLFLLIVSANE